MAALPIKLDRARKIPLAAQIYAAIREGIENGRLASGARLPSWQDLAAQLGVSRGTVRVAYERLIAEQFAIGLGSAGTRVAERQSRSPIPDQLPEAPLLPDVFYDFGSAPLAFQMGVPAQDAFPFKLWSRILSREARRAAAAPVTYPDPRGDPELRKQIASYLGLARGVRCSASQVFVTAGFSGALGLAIRGLQPGKTGAWIEDPGFPLTRTALELAGVGVTAVPVDGEGLDVAAGVRMAPRAKLAVVTPGQQAPLGMTMSLPRRLALLAWARRNDAWIIEDDYLSELQLKGRAAPALASLDHGGRVLQIGSFSNDQPGAAPRLHGRTAGTESPVWRTRGLPGAGARGRFSAGCGGISARWALPSPLAPHEAALRCATGEPAPLSRRDRANLDQSAGDRGSRSGSPASQVCIRRGRRFTRPAFRSRAKSAVPVVYAAASAARTAALRN
jgi:GntR family transcriptional regulator/MocR family aminotransferase